MQNLTEFGARGLLGKYGLARPKAELTKSESDATKISEKIGFPLVLKLMSPDILHKSDAGCVRINLWNAAEIAKAFPEIIANAKKYNPSARIEGVLVEEQVSGTELIVGAKRDAQFGPLILFGLGGIFVEATKDVSIRLAPITRNDAREMIYEIKGHKLLLGYRGKKPVNLKAVENALLSVSRMVIEHPEIKEMDINPLFADEKGAVVGDARIALG